MSKDEWMARLMGLRDPVAGRIMMAAVAMLDKEMTGDAREWALAAAIGCTPGAIRDALRELEHAELISVMRNFGWLQ